MHRQDGPSVDRILYTREVIEERVKELAAQIVGVYRGQPIVAAIALQGAYVFAADLLRHVPNEVELLFVRASSYGNGTVSSGEPIVEFPGSQDLTGRHVLVIEDIVDTGRTIQALVSSIRGRGAASVRTCTFLDKPVRREVKAEPEFIGFTLVGDPFVVGYGLDYAGRFRNLPYVGTLRSEEEP